MISIARVLLLLALFAAACVRAADAPLTPADWQAIKRVIGDQLAALRNDDGARAFSFASRGLQAQFENADNFMRMVHAGYQPLIDARYDEFLEGAAIDDRVIQPLRLVLRDDTVLVALYTMQKEDDGRWRIAGCMLAPSTLKSASIQTPTIRPSAGPSKARLAPAQGAVIAVSAGVV